MSKLWTQINRRILPLFNGIFLPTFGLAKTLLIDGNSNWILIGNHKGSCN